MTRKTISCGVSEVNATWIEREFMPARGLRDIGEAFESLINAYRASMGAAEIGEPNGQRLIRDALGRSLAEPLTVAQICAASGLSLPTVRMYLARLKTLGHVVGGQFVKTATNFAQGFALTPPGRRAWIATIRDPEERAIQEMNAADLEARGE